MSEAFNDAGLRRTLSRSHRAIAALGAVLLVVPLAAIVLLRSETLSLVRVRAPMVRASTQALVGVEHSLAALRRWLVLSDSSYKKERLRAWRAEIEPAITVLQTVGQPLSDPHGGAQLIRLMATLHELKEQQRRVEDLAGNLDTKPAPRVLIEQIDPIADTVRSALSQLITDQKALQPGTAGNVRLGLMMDVRASFARANGALDEAVGTASLLAVENFKNSLARVQRGLISLLTAEPTLLPAQRERLETIKGELQAYEKIAHRAITIRFSENWNRSRYLMDTEVIPMARTATGILSALANEHLQQMRVGAADVKRVSDLTLLLMIAVLVFFALLGWWLAKRSAERMVSLLSALAGPVHDTTYERLTAGPPATGDGDTGVWVRSSDALRAADGQHKTAPEQGNDALARANCQLTRVIDDHKRTEQALREAQNALEKRVQERTAELVKANEALQVEIAERRNVEEKFRLVIEGSPDAMVIVNQAGEIVLINAQTEKVFGYCREELTGRPVGILVPEVLRRQHEDHRIGFFDDAQPRTMGVGRDLLARRKDGSEFPVEIGLNPIKTTEETLVLSVIVDITDRKRAEERLITLSRAIEQSPNAVMITSPDARIEYVNPKFTELTGFTKEELIGQNPRLLQSGYTSPEVYQGLWEMISSGAEWRGVIRDKKKNGQLYWAQEAISSIKNSDGRITHFIATQEDITDFKRVEHALQESEQRFRQMADMAGEWIWEQNPEGRYIYSSSAVKDIAGYQPEEVVGQYFYDLFPVEEQEKVSQIQYINENKEPFFGLTNHYRHKDGHMIITESTGAPILDGHGNLIKWRGVDRDITERIQAEQEIRRSHIKLAVAKHEMKIARQIQESLLPSAPLIMPGVYVQGNCLPAAQVGGDYFDYFPRQSGAVDVVIADVSGHSVGPALFMVETRSALRTHAHLTHSPADTMVRMNELLYEDLSQADHFITMFYMRYDRLHRRLSYANAGQCPPLLLRPGEPSCTELDADGLVLGVMKRVDFEEKQLDLKAGDMVFLYTDGITEAENPQGEFFGLGRLCNTLTQHIHLEPKRLIDVLVSELQCFCQKKTFSDDVTVVILKVSPSTIERD